MILGNICFLFLSLLYVLLSFLPASCVFAVCAGGKAPLPEEKPGPGAVPQAEPREQRTLEGQGGDHAGDHAGSKLEGKAFTFSLHPPGAWRHLPLPSRSGVM